jgi:hypothetical protein
MIPPEIDNLLPIDDDFEEESITCTCTASNINNSMEELIMEERIRVAQEACRQRRMCTYFVLTIYLIIAILYFRRRHQKET